MNRHVGDVLGAGFRVLRVQLEQVAAVGKQVREHAVLGLALHAQRRSFYIGHYWYFMVGRDVLQAFCKHYENAIATAANADLHLLQAIGGSVNSTEANAMLVQKTTGASGRLLL